MKTYRCKYLFGSVYGVQVLFVEPKLMSQFFVPNFSKNAQSVTLRIDDVYTFRNWIDENHRAFINGGAWGATAPPPL